MTGDRNQLRIDFGRRWLTPQELAALETGNVIQLETRVDDLAEVYVNGHLFARGEAVVADGKLGVRVSELVK